MVADTPQSFVHFEFSGEIDRNWRIELDSKVAGMFLGWSHRSDPIFLSHGMKLDKQ